MRQVDTSCEYPVSLETVRFRARIKATASRSGFSPLVQSNGSRVSSHLGVINGVEWNQRFSEFSQEAGTEVLLMVTGAIDTEPAKVRDLSGVVETKSG